MITEERAKKLPSWIQRILNYLNRIRIPARVIYIVISLLATLWFLFRVIPKPSRATYPCMQVAAPFMSGFVVWLLALGGSTLAYTKAKENFYRAKYVAAFSLLVVAMGGIAIFIAGSSSESKADALKIWYKPNIPLGEAKGIFPGRVAWSHNPKISTWDGKTGNWWEDRFNNQTEIDRLLSDNLFTLTGERNEKKAWDVLFVHFNKNRNNSQSGYRKGQKIAIKINQNNTNSHQSSDEINANPHLILSLLKSLIVDAGVSQKDISVADPSRFITDNIYNKCHSVYPDVRYIDHDGGDGREASTFVANAIPYSVDNGKVATGLATCFVEADYIINMAILKGHVSQGVTLCAKNFFGCTDIETDWRKNAHSGGFSQKMDGSHTYSVYPDYIGHKDLGAKTVLYMVDFIYSNKFLNQVPASRWSLTPFNNHWPSSLLTSQDPVAVDAVALDFALAEWPDAPDMMYSDYSVNESALANNPPSGTVYDPERDGTPLKSLGTSEHWNNPTDKQYSRNLKTGNGIELVYRLTKQ